jgi:hypothetical protein
VLFVFAIYQMRDFAWTMLLTDEKHLVCECEKVFELRDKRNRVAFYRYRFEMLQLMEKVRSHPWT